MTTEASPNARCAELIRVLEELKEKLEAGEQIDDGVHRVIATFLTDAILAGDDETLAEGEHRIKNIYHSVSHEPAREQLVGYIYVIPHALQRIIPQAVLDQLTPDSLQRRLLDTLNPRPTQGMTLVQLSSPDYDLGPDSRQIETALQELGKMGMVSPRYLGQNTYWEITPRGRHALHLTRP